MYRDGVKGLNARNNWSTFVVRGTLFAIIWWVLTNGIVASWWIGVLAVLFSVIVSIALLPPMHLVWRELLKFMPFFLMRSMLGGVDVAWRAFHPCMPIAPDLIEYPLRLPQGLPRLMMVNTVSLLPGTLSVEFDQNLLKVHVLDRRQDFLTELITVEQSVARMFGIPVHVSEGGE